MPRKLLAFRRAHYVLARGCEFLTTAGGWRSKIPRQPAPLIVKEDARATHPRRWGLVKPSSALALASGDQCH
jgi:hypothetical protein